MGSPLTLRRRFAEGLCRQPLIAPSVRVFFATPYPLAAASGVSSFVADLAARVRASGGEAIVSEPSGREPKAWGNVALALRSARGLLRRRDVDLVHCQQLHMQAAVVTILGRVLGKTVLTTVHGRSPRPAGLRGWAFGVAERLAKRTPNHLVYVAHSLQAELGGGSVIRNGVRVAALRARLQERERTRADLGLSDAFAILFVGRITRDKGVPVLLDAFRSVRESAAHPVRLLLVGPVADDILSLVDPAPAGVDVLGPRSDVPRLLVAADAFVLPSLREGLPLSLLEAMAVGLPVVASSVGDIPEVVRDGVTGRLVTPGSVPSLSAAIEEFVRDRQGARTCGARAADLVTSEYDAERTWAEYARLYAPGTSA